LVERLSDAERNGHQVLAVLRGSAVNQDGASNGLTAPNGPSQQRVIRQALANARLEASDVDAVEAHGTGTKLGDPIEAQALLATYGRDRDADRPLWLGSVKSNIGHTQAAAGVASVIKMVEAMRHGVLPKTLHVDEPTPHVDWTAGTVDLLTEQRDWPATDEPRRAGVSSFGVSGTNAHVILEQGPQTAPVSAPQTAPAPAPETEPVPGADAPVLWPLSGQTPEALRAQATRLIEAVTQDPPAGLADIAHSLATTRAHLAHRAAVVGANRAELVEGLAALAEGRAVPGLVQGVDGGGGRAVFVFPGQGAQWQGMALELLDASPVFAERLAEAGRALAPYTDWTLEDALRGRADLERVEVSQPTLFAVTLALAAVWQDWGIRPAAVVGHSQGEIAAACVAGVLTLDDAARLVALRARALSRLAGRGGMVSVALPVDRVREDLAAYEDQVAVGAVNGPRAVVVAGEPAALDELVAAWTAEDVWVRRVPMHYAPHSPQVEEIRAELEEAFASVRPLAGNIPIYSTVTGRVQDGTAFDSAYWYANLRDTVDFHEATRSLLADGYGVFVESSPHPVLTMGVQGTADEAGVQTVAVGSLRRDHGGMRALLTSLARLHLHGVRPDWAKVFPGARRAELPTYAFQHAHYWPRGAALRAGDASRFGLGAADHPLLGAAVLLARGGGVVLTGRLALDTHPWLTDHRVSGRAVVPGTALLEMAVRAGDQVGCPYVEELTLEAPMVLPETGGLQVQVGVETLDATGGCALSIHARPDGDEDALWTRHADALLTSAAPRTAASGTLAGPVWPPADAVDVPVPAEQMYADLAERGLVYGPGFRGLHGAWRRGDEVFAEITLPEPASAEAALFAVHPALLDAALHAGGFGEFVSDPAVGWLPFSWRRAAVLASGAGQLRVRLAPSGPDTLTLEAADADGAPVLTVDGIALRPLPSGPLGGTDTGDTLFQVRWTAAGQAPETEPRPTVAPWRYSADADGLDRLLADRSTAPDVTVLRYDSAAAAATGPDEPEDVHARALGALSAVQRWLADERFAQSRLAVVTRGAVGPHDEPDRDPGGAAVWGLLRAAQAENPGRLVLIDTDATPGDDAAPADSGAEAGTDAADAVDAVVHRALPGLLALDEPQFVLRGGDVLVPRVTRAKAPDDTTAGSPFHAESTVLITGATGTLGGLVARELAAVHGVRSFVLAGRRGPDAPGMPELVAELAYTGAEAAVVAVDVADPAALTDLLTAHPVTAVVHAAGVLDDGVLDTLTPERAAAVLRPKADAALHLDRITRELGLELTAFVLFSSAAGVFGNAGQAAYAAANSVLDALAERRSAQGLPGTALAWGLWDEASGMTAHLDGTDLRRVQRGGAGALGTEEGLRLFSAAVRTTEPVLLPMRLDLAQARAAAARHGVPPLLRTLVRAPARRTVTAGSATGAGLAGLAGLRGADRERAVLAAVTEQVAAVLGHTGAHTVDPKKAFKELGFDSLTAVELRNRLAPAVGLRLPATLVFDHPSPQALARYICAELGDDDTPHETAAASPQSTAPTAASAADDPIAIVAMSCRYPGGVRSPEQLWQLVAGAGDAISPFPQDRGWDFAHLDADGPDSALNFTREGGFLHDAADFDPELFGISPREAMAMDPQQRLLLEITWEAFERAGIDPSSLRGTRAGVFAGVMYQDYTDRLLAVPEGVEGHLGTGNTGSVVSGRVAYSFGLEGPAVTIDTACSSSLVAMHLAAQSLRQGESTLALAGGVTVMSTPNLFVDFSRQGGLASDGRIKSFAGAADGTVWGEGAGVLLLERLSDARRNGHPVLAVLRGSAVNQDGASNGLTAPNGPSQQRVIRAALANAGLSASDVDAVEAHGTGTTLGDPIEAQALLATYGKDRDGDRPLWLGSVKSNIGHTQAAAGVAGVIKMVEAMRRGVLPQTLHVDEPTPRVEWAAGSVELLTEPRPWAAGGQPRRAGISSFGISGTNVHAIIEEPPAPAPAPAPKSVPDDTAGVVPWLLSGASEDALRAQSRRLAAHLGERKGLRPADVGFSLVTSRAVLEHRAVVVGSSRDELVAGLADVATRGPASTGGLVLLFTGQGAQRAGMGRELYAAYPVFAEAFDAVCARLDGGLGRSLKGVVFDGGGEGLLDRTRFTQAALFAVEVALYRLVESWGVRPDALLGHSVGEIAAAHVAGVLSLDDACALVDARGRLMDALPEGGAMVAVEASEGEVRAALVEGVSIAAVNGPRAVVISGDEAPVEQVAAVLAERGSRTKKLSVSHAFHSARMEPMLEEFRAVAQSLRYETARIPVVSNLTGGVAGPELSTPEYWVRHVREAVRFADGVHTLHAQGVTRFVELGPDGVLTAMAQGVLTDVEDALFVPVLRKDRDEATNLVTGLGQLHAHGGTVDWEAFFAGTGTQPVDLPTYAFQYQRYWIDAAELPDTAPDAVENAFWDTVEREDLEAFAETLDLEPGDLETVLPALSSWRRRRQEQDAADDWFYEETWVAVPDRADLPARAEGRLVVVAEDEAGSEAAEALRDRGARIFALPLDLVHDELVERLRAADAPLGIVSLLPTVAATLALVRAAEEAGPRVWTLTRAAVAAGPADPAVEPEAAGVWGIGRVAALELPQLWGGLIDLPASPADRDWDRVCAVLADESEDQVAVRPAGVYARRLTRTNVGRRNAWRPRGTVLITGGTGALGAQVARWAVAEGAERLVLTSRRGPDAPGAAELRDELVAQGAEVAVVAVDAADRDALSGVLAAYPPDAVVHAAGVTQSTPLRDMDAEELHGVVAAKADGARHLDELTRERTLDAFVLFSSVAGVWGSGGQGAYAAANAELDAVARRRTTLGLPATSLVWGPWDEGGMAVGPAGDELRRRGLRPLAPGAALAAMGRIAGTRGCVIVADVDWERFGAAYSAARPSPLLSALYDDGTTATAERAEAPAAAELRRKLAGLSEAETRRTLVDLVRTHASAVLGRTAGDTMAANKAFREVGFDSLTAVELRGALSEATGLPLPATVVFDYPTPTALADFLRSGLADDETDAGAGTGAVTAAAPDEPIAIVGMACRFPGDVNSPRELWELLAEGGDAIGAFPTDRGWDVDALYDPDPDRTGTSYARDGGFLAAASEFDAEFFGISPREALSMDPQQRLLLETSWEAFEGAGLDPEILRGSQAGVFVGTNGQDYASLLVHSGEPVEGYLATGNAASVVSGRLAYTFGLEGPAVTVDTACSSSLVALHWAAQSLRQGECSMALAGGVTIMATPTAFIEFSRQRGLASDGRVKAFAGAADGTGWGEGVGMLVLERLSDAERNGHQVLAVLRGSAVNQDGASNGLTAPNGPSQQRVIRQALANARLEASDVDAVEAHGTGTKLGDPIEAQALLATYGKDRDADRPLWLGSVKSNIGHTQAAAGVASVIKMVEAMRHGVLPKTLHVDEPTPHVDWTAGTVDLLTEQRDWPATDEPRRAGVSSFGVSGTNAHLILEEAPAPAPATVQPDTGPEQSPVLPWLLSARTEDALRAQAARLHALVAADDDTAADPAAVSQALAATRARFEHRAAIVAADRDGLLHGLEALAEGRPAASVVQGRARQDARLAFLFSGQGSQLPRMGAELYRREPRFAAALDEVRTVLDPLLERPVLDLLLAPQDTAEATLLDETQHTQAALFALEVALYRLVEQWGLVPDMLLGHSIGELAAAHVAGVLSLPDACTLVAARGRLMAELPRGGAMAALGVPEDDVLPLLTGREDHVCVAAVNGPASTVISGDEAAVHEIAGHFREQGRRTKALRVSHAFHSPHMDGMLDAFREVAEQLTYHAPAIPLISDVTGELLPAHEPVTAEYWVRHVRGTVRFADGVHTARAAGATDFLEVGPDGVLTAMAQDCLSAESAPDRDETEPATAVAALRRGRDDTEALATALATLDAHGAGPDWNAVFGGRPARPVTLPTYAFQRKRYWPRNLATATADVTAAGLGTTGHPLLQAVVCLADSDTYLFTARLAVATHPWLADHAVGDALLLPGTAFLELAARAGDQADCAHVEELTLVAPLVLPASGAVQLQLSLDAPDQAGRRALTVHGRPDAPDTGTETPWTLHATGLLAPAAATDTAAADDTVWPPAGAEPVALEGFYDTLATDGFGYGPAFQGLRAVWRRGDELFAEATLPADSDERAAAYTLHPALLDAALHALACGTDDDAPSGLPFEFAGVTLHAAGATALRVALTRTGGTVTLRASDSTGAPVADIESLTLRPVSTAQLAPAERDPLHDWLLRVDWTAAPAPAPDTEPPSHTTLGDGGAHPDLAALGAAVDTGTAPAPALVVVPLPPTGTTGTDSTTLARTAHETVHRALRTVQDWLADERFAASRLLIVTRGATSAAPGADMLPGAAVWGLLRSAQSENPGRLVVCDLDTTDGELPAAALHLAATGAEPQLAVREDTVKVPRLARALDGPALVPPTGHHAWHVDIEEGGTLDDLKAVPAERALRPLADNEVRIAVRAAGLNFRDVLMALGMYPTRAQLGSEGAGVVTEVGAAVTGLAVGDRVLGLFSDAFGPLAVADARTVVRMPRNWSFAQAASVPLTFLTAYYALSDLGDLRAGQSVLVHSAAGGVGMAAVQLARHWGAEVYATAGHAKWDAVRALGVADDHLASSRDTLFAERFAYASGGRGVDVVLNSLAHEYVDASLRLLPRGGRFLEMGKTDVRDTDEVATAHEGVHYRAFDLMDAGLDRIGAMLADLMDLFEQGAVHPLPLTTWDVRRAPEAFRYVSQARHTGKVVLTVPPARDPDGTVLVTGATGALGRRVARHLVTEHGVRHLLLAGRRGPDAPGAAELVAELAESGAKARTAACDLADRDAVAALLATVPDAHPLTAVVHVAGILDDGVVTALDADRVDRVMAPKADAVLHLHELTRHLDLAEFTVFSSAAAVFGGAGQANYAAANSFLDAFARHRRALGLPATSLAWGLWEDADSMAADLGRSDRSRIDRAGVGALTPEEGMALFDRAGTLDDADLVPVKTDLAALRAHPETVPPLLRGLVRAPVRRAAARNAGGTDTASFARRLNATPPQDRDRLLLDLVRGHVAAVLGLDGPETIEPRRAFKDLGFDSLTAVELRNRLTAECGCRLPATLVFDHPTPQALVEHLHTELVETRDTETATAAPVRTAAAADEPLAIVGMACRFPGGVNTPEDLWALLAAGADGITAFPADRGWDLAALHGSASDTQEGGFVQGAGEFDPVFFNISPREALAMDPQQRLLLETSWEAVERAGIDPTTLRGRAAGVFVGAAGSNYGAGLRSLPDGVAGHLLTGNATSVASGRVSYAFGLEGPAVTIDTACSSSLVALHLAAQSLRQGECDMALAGGVTVMATPGAFTEFSRQGGLASDGRCKAFAGAADGTGWGEGVGMLLVERLSDAERNGHPVLAVVRGSATNQDGASNGLTAPNGPAQQRVIRAALANAGLSASDVDVVEAHGTGTKLGDPIEAQALLATYGKDRDADRPLWLGSIKSNIGHTQSAAGVAGVMKTVLALQHGVLPKTLHVDEPTPHVDWTEGAVRLLTEPVAWPRAEKPLRAGVSSFGISGTNAHVILEQGPTPEPESDQLEDESTVPWVLSGRSEAALRGQAARLLTAAVDESPADVGFSLVTSRAQLEHRAVVVGASRDELVVGLEAVVEGRGAAGVVEGVASDAGRVVFVFPGQGSQWQGMALELMESSPVFAARMAECGEALAAFTDWSFEDALHGRVDVERVDVVQPLLFAVMVSLAAVWRDWGVRPSAVMGHSQGEIAAACVAGALSLEDAARVVALRSRSIVALAGRGGMVSVPLPVDRVREELSGFEGRVSVAAVNGPNSVVISGDVDGLDELLARWSETDVRARRIAVDYASHSAHVERLRDEILDVLSPIRPQAGEIPVYSTVTGQVEDGSAFDAEYWYTNLRQTVEFETATRNLLADGHGVFVESSPHPVVSIGIQETIEDVGSPAITVGSLRRSDGDLDRLLTSLAELHVHGVTPDWSKVFPPGAHRVDLPTYAFQHQHYWLEDTNPGAPADAADGVLGSVEAAFWETVERDDFTALAGELDVAPDAPMQAVLPALSAWRRRRQRSSAVDQWTYRVAWHRVADPEAVPLTGTWLLVVPDGLPDRAAGHVDASAEALRQGGADVRTVILGTDDQDRGAIAERVRDVIGTETAAGVLSLLALAPGTHQEFTSARLGLSRTAALVQALGDLAFETPLWCATRSAVQAAQTDTVEAPEQAMVWGLGRVVALEHPEIWGGLVDLPDTWDERAADRLRALLSGAAGEDQAALRPAGILGRRLLRTEPSAGQDGEHAWQPSGTVLITGGTGALGAHVARRLARNGAPHLLLASRRGPDAPDAAELTAELTGLGARVTVVACDLTSRAQTEALLASVPDDAPLTAVVHTAAVLDDGVVDTLDPKRIDRAAGPKVDGALHLHELTRDRELSAFVLFSSFAGTFGTPGQGNYAPGNAFLDALAQQRRAQGLPATSVAWGPWGGDGMADGAVGEVARRHGVASMDPDSATEALYRAIDDGEPYTTVADIDWSRFYTAFTATRPSPFVSLVPEARHAAANMSAQAAPTAGAEADTSGTSLVARLVELAPDEQQKALLDLVRTHVASVLGYQDPQDVGERRAFREIGFDSVTAVELRNRLGTVTGRRFPATLVFDHPSPAALAEHLRGELIGDAASKERSPLDEIDRLDAALSGLGEPDETTRSRVVQRLQTLLSKWDGAPRTAEETADALVSASADEMFDLIDRELGM
ncbi:type I polyketide synthase, partial [Streptomyces sp. NPDC048612]|uniref:type I polyketide synthase n=1 Tax=Streptomyces sp. NPDC048612 TaxID=3365579 RepID=UPI003712A38C